MTAQWKYVIPIEKAVFDDQGDWVLTGVVAGPDYVDAAGDEFLPEAIQKMADFINANPLPVKDWHGLNDKYDKNTIMESEMGDTQRAWVEPQTGELNVDIVLDKTHPTSVWLKDKIDNKKRKFGFSIHGMAANPKVVSKAGQIVKQIADVIPDELSLTTRPFYQPSLGTVISKAIDEAAEAELVEKGDKSSMSSEAPPKTEPMSPEDNKDSLLPAVDAAPETPGVEPVTEVPEPDVMQNVAVVEPVEVTVEKSVVEREADALRDLITNIVRQEINNSKVEPVAPSAADTSAEVAVEKSQVDQPDRLTVIEKAMSDLSAQLERVLETVPEVKAPGVLVSKSQEEEIRDTFATLSPMDRVRLGFQLQDQKLR
jgi:hypothetical protein